MRVGYRDDSVVVASDESSVPSEIDDVAGDAVSEIDFVSDVERIGEGEKDAGDDVREGLLKCETENEGSDAAKGEERGQGESALDGEEFEADDGNDGPDERVPDPVDGFESVSPQGSLVPAQDARYSKPFQGCDEIGGEYAVANGRHCGRGRGRDDHAEVTTKFRDHVRQVEHGKNSAAEKSQWSKECQRQRPQIPGFAFRPVGEHALQVAAPFLLSSSPKKTVRDPVLARDRVHDREKGQVDGFDDLHQWRQHFVSNFVSAQFETSLQQARSAAQQFSGFESFHRAR